MNSSDEEFSENDDNTVNNTVTPNSSINSLIQPLYDSDSRSMKSSSYPSEKICTKSSLFERNTFIAKTGVLLTVVIERLVYYGLLGNLAVFTNFELSYTAEESALSAILFQCFSWITCLIGSILGDVILGRFKTILVGLFCYIAGFLSISLLAYFNGKLNTDGELAMKTPYVCWFVLSLIFISLGEGCFKSNSSVFGADQMTNAHDQELRTFFNYFYWVINLGSFFGYTLLTLMQQELSFFAGYIASTGLLALGMIVFLLPKSRSYYHIVESRSSLLKMIFRVCKNALRKSRSKLKFRNQYESFVPVQHWLDKAKIQYGGQFSDTDVDNVKKFFNTIPILLCIIVYCACYSQISGLFLIQGIHMKIISIGNFSFPACWFTVFNIVTVVVFVPIINRYFYPWLDKRFKFLLSPYVKRMALGMILASLSMVSAGVVEHFREQTHHRINSTVNSNIVIEGKDIEIRYQIPQYSLMGLSEVFVLVAGLEYAYCEAPRSMQSLVTGVFFLCYSLGSLLSSALLAICNAADYQIIISSRKRTSKNFIPGLDEASKMDQYFYFLGMLNILNMIIMVLNSIRKRKHKVKRDLEDRVAAYIQRSLDSSVRSSS